MMNEERISYLESGSGGPPDRERLDAIRALLAEEAMWADPPARIGGQVMEEVGEGHDHAVSSGRSPWLAVAVIFGAVIVAVAAAAAGVFGERPEMVIAMAGTDLEPAAAGEAGIGSSGSGWWIRLELDGLPAADQGTYYEGWMWNDEGDGVSIGTFHLRNADDPVILWSGVDPDDYPSVWITLEDEDGDASASDRVVMMGRNGT